MRTRQKLANIQEIKKLVVNNGVTDNRPIIAVVMRECGATFNEIAEVMDFSRQMAKTMVQKAQASNES